MHNHHDKRRSGSMALAFLMGTCITILVGGYMLFGPQGQRRRDAIQKFVDDAEEKLLHKMYEIKDMSKEAYESLVDEVIGSYQDVKELTERQVKHMKARLKSRYEEIKKRAHESADQARKETDELQKRGNAQSSNNNTPL